MRGNPVGICGSLAALCLVAIAVAPLCAADQTGVVEGVAFNRVTKAGVPNAAIHFGTFWARSGASGAFRVEAVPEGDYTISIGAPEGFFGNQSLRIHVGPRTPKLEIPLVPMGRIRGRVLDPDGRPIANMRVEVFRMYDEAVHILSTNSEGLFGSSEIGPGLYRLRPCPVLEGSILGKRKENLSNLAGGPSEGERWMWCPTYFPNATDVANAEPIFVGEGVERAGLDIRLRAAPVFQLRGVVEDPEGKPAAGISVELESQLGWGAGEMEALSDANGGFAFPSVRAGEWRIAAHLKRGNVEWRGRAALTMPARDYDRARVRIDPPFQFFGALEGAPGKGRTGVTAVIEPSDGGDPLVAIELSGGPLQFDSVYPGRYRAGLWAELPGYYVKSILLGPNDVTGGEADLMPSSPPLRIVFAPNAARATGVVENGPRVHVVLVSADRQFLMPGQAMRFAVTDDEGRFTFEGVRSGAWHAFAFDTSDNLNSAAIRDLVFGRGGRVRGAEVIRLGEGETANLKLRVSPWFE